MVSSPLIDAQLEQIGWEFYVARTLARYLRSVDRRTRNIILQEMHYRQVQDKIPYKVGSVSFEYRKESKYAPNKEKLVNDFGLEAAVAIAKYTKRTIEEFLRSQHLSPDPTPYLLNVGSHDVLDTPKIQPTLDPKRIEGIVNFLVQQVTTNKKT